MKSYGVTIQMKATEQYFPVILFIILHQGVLAFHSGWSRQIETTQPYSALRVSNCFTKVKLVFFPLELNLAAEESGIE